MSYLERAAQHLELAAEKVKDLHTYTLQVQARIDIARQYGQLEAIEKGLYTPDMVADILTHAARGEVGR